MQLESYALDVIAQRVEGGFDAALDEVVKDAQRRAKKVTGTWAASIQRTDIVETSAGYSARVGSNLSSALAHERGAYIRAKRSDWLYIPFGDGTLRKVKAVRIKAHPAITPAVKTFSRRFGAEMKSVNLRSRKARTVR